MSDGLTQEDELVVTNLCGLTLMMTFFAWTFLDSIWKKSFWLCNNQPILLREQC